MIVGRPPRGSAALGAFVRASARLLLAILFALALCRALWYCVYVLIRVQSPFDVQFVEAAMVHNAWRVQHGVSLYPNWEHYPYVANFYGPLSFLLIGTVGKLLGTDIRGLYLIGRGVSVVSVLAATLLVGFVLRRRYNAPSALFGMLLTLGICPLFAAGVMTRPDALAEFLGLTGFFLAEGRRRATGIAAGLLLCLAPLTKQTALVYLVAAALGLCLDGRKRRGLVLLAGVSATLAATVAVVQWRFEPNFARSLLGDSHTPFRFAAWWGAMSDVATMDPEFFVLIAAGLVLWNVGQKREPALSALAIVLLAASLVCVAKIGSAANYFIGVGYIAALAGGTFYFEMTRAHVQPKAWQFVAAVAVAVGLCSSLKATNAYVQLARIDARLMARNDYLDFKHRLFRTAEDPDRHLLTDNGQIDIHHGERTIFADPYRFKLMVELGQIDPTRLKQMIDHQEFDLIATETDLFSERYLRHDRGLPGTLVETARLRYKPTAVLFGWFLYTRRGESSSP